MQCDKCLNNCDPNAVLEQKYNELLWWIWNGPDNTFLNSKAYVGSYIGLW